MSRTIGTARGKVIAITGAARGIGLATAKRLIADGAQVAICDIDELALKHAAGELGVTTYAAVDVTDPESFGSFFDLVESELGPLDVVVNNAGIMPIGPFDRETDHASRRIIEINVLGVLFGTKLALARMLPRRRGHVINIASIAGESYVPGGATYCASKHAVKALTESLRREYRGSGVAFSQVQPTFTNTELVSGTFGTKGMRNAEPHEVAAAVAALVARPRPVVRVTRWAGVLAGSQNFVPRRVGEAIARSLGAEAAFTEIDQHAREAYEERVRSV